MATFRETWHLAGLLLRWAAMVPLVFLGAALALFVWIVLWLLEAVSINPLLVLGGTTALAELSRAVMTYAIEGRCPRCGWAVTRHAYQLLSGHLPASRIELLSEGPSGTTVLIDGWLARRALAAVEHVKQIGGDPCAVIGTLFESMYQLTPGDVGQRGPN